MGRMATRNKQPIWYANYVCKKEVLDDNQNPTGTYRIIYTVPVKTYANIRAVDSDAEIEMFGVAAKDTIRILAEKVSLPITAESVLWFGKEPSCLSGKQPTDYNYRVVGAPPTRIDALFYAVRI